MFLKVNRGLGARGVIVAYQPVANVGLTVVFFDFWAGRTAWPFGEVSFTYATLEDREAALARLDTNANTWDPHEPVSPTAVRWPTYPWQTGTP